MNDQYFVMAQLYPTDVFFSARDIQYLSKFCLSMIGSISAQGIIKFQQYRDFEHNTSVTGFNVIGGDLIGDFKNLSNGVDLYFELTEERKLKKYKVTDSETGEVLIDWEF